MPCWARLKRWPRTAGNPQLTLMVGSFNKRADQLYLRSGFAERGAAPVHGLSRVGYARRVHLDGQRPGVSNSSGGRGVAETVASGRGRVPRSPSALG